MDSIESDETIMDSIESDEMGDINELTWYGVTPLIEECTRGNFSEAKDLIESSHVPVEANTRDDQGNTAFLYVCAHGSLEFVKYMMESPDLDVDIHMTGVHERTALHFACISESAENAKYLLTLEGFEAYQFKKDKKGNIPIHSGCQYGRSIAPMEYLIQADETNTLCNIRDKQRFTVLHLACQDKERFDFAECLVRLSETSGMKMNMKDRRGHTPLHNACEHGLLRTVKCLMTNNESNSRPTIDPNIQDNKGRTPFHLAWSNKHTDVMDFLLHTKHVGMYLDVADRNGDTALHLLFRSYKNGSIHLINSWMAIAGFHEALRMQNNKGRTPFHYACEHGWLCAVTCLMTNDESNSRPSIDPNIQDHEGKTLFHLAWSNKHADVMDFLLHTEHVGMHLDVADQNGDTALHLLFRWCKGEPIHLIKGWMAIPGFHDALRIQNSDGDTPFHLACRLQNILLVDFLIESDEVNVDARTTNGKGDTPFHIAFGAEDDTMLQYLLRKHGTEVDKNAKNNDGNTVLHIAAANYVSSANNFWERLTRDHLDARIQNNEGDTVFHLAMKTSQERMVRTMLTSNNVTLDVTITNNNGDTALHLGCTGKHADAVMPFLELHPKMTAQNNDGNTPLHLAYQNERSEILMHLLRDHMDYLDHRIRNKDGNTPAHLANKDRVIPFLQPAANIQNNDGDTALHHAASNGFIKIAKSLIRTEGADVTIKNGKGKTAITLARRKAKTILPLAKRQKVKDTVALLRRACPKK